MSSLIVSGIITGTHWSAIGQFLLLSLETIPEVFAKVNSVSSIIKCEFCNRRLPSSKNPHFQNEAKCRTFLVKINCICMKMKSHFHIKGWGLNLVSIQRPGGTRQWHIVSRHLRELTVICGPPHLCPLSTKIWCLSALFFFQSNQDLSGFSSIYCTHLMLNATHCLVYHYSFRVIFKVRFRKAKILRNLFQKFLF